MGVVSEFGNGGVWGGVGGGVGFEEVGGDYGFVFGHGFFFLKKIKKN